ncbi:hypothetical protein RND71_034709 [Anisodus tanguticus]|uniref:Rab-GAP TBC domain-containing protein n=1 Tax=Anisodus tanguticus TaxID=243964 RepID=A0AAE1R3Q5_9SOLA|nr:hypothetical protein RND71_034709 [Anisodus tanguticus]
MGGNDCTKRCKKGGLSDSAINGGSRFGSYMVNRQYDSLEESSWTFYFQDFMSNNNNYNEQTSLCSDEFTNKNGVLNINDNENNNKNFVFKKRKMKGAAVDDDFEDTASSPVNSPKVSYMNEFCIKSQKGKSAASILEKKKNSGTEAPAGALYGGTASTALGTALGSMINLYIKMATLDISKMWRDPGAPADSFYQVRPECKDVPKSKFRIKGIHPSIRGEVWEFLLGCYDPKSTYAEREDIRQQRRTQYAILKEECRTMFPVIGSGRFITAPVITEDGDPILDPLVLQEAKEAKAAKEAKEATSAGQQNGNPEDMMWALEYDPDLFLTYEDPELVAEKSEESKTKAKSRQCGKYERENMKNAGKAVEAPLPISVFLVASVLKDKSDKLLTEARGLDDVVKILNDVNGNLDAKKACTGAMKLHKKYLKKAANTNR